MKEVTECDFQVLDIKSTSLPLCVSVSLITLSGSQLPYNEETQAAPWRGLYGKELRPPANGKNILTRHVSDRHWKQMHQHHSSFQANVGQAYTITAIW